MRNVVALLALVSACHAGFSSAGALYKCTTGGKVVYQDTVCPGGASSTVKPPPVVDAAEARAAESRLLKDRQAIRNAETEKRLSESRARLMDAQANLAETMSAHRSMNSQMSETLKESRCKTLEVLTIRAEKRALQERTYESGQMAQARRAEYMGLCP